MAEDKEKSLTDETLPKEPEETSASWDWDAAVPQTDTSNITLDDLQETEEKVVEQPAEEPEENETEKEEEAPASNPDDDGLCIVCGKERGNSPSDLYCNACRAKFLRTNYGVGHIILAFVMVIVAALGYFVATSTVTVSSKLYKAEQCISEKRYNDALNLCSEAFDATDKLNSGVNAVIKGINSNAANQDWFTEGEKATHLILETYVHNMTINASDRQTFVEAVEKYYTNGELDQPRNADIKKLYNAIKSVDAIATSLDEKMNSFVTQKEDGTYDVKYDEGIKFFDSYKVDTDIEKGLMEYYKFMLAYYANKDSKTALDFIDNAYKISGEYGYLYLQNYMGMAWQYKEYERCLSFPRSQRSSMSTMRRHIITQSRFISKRMTLIPPTRCVRKCARQIPTELTITAQRLRFSAVRTSSTKRLKFAARVLLQARIPKFTVSRLLHISSRATRRTRSKQSSSRMKLQLKISSFQFRRQTLLLLSASSATIQRRMKRLMQCSSKAAWSSATQLKSVSKAT